MNMKATKERSNSGIDVAGTGFTVMDRIYANGVLKDETLGGSCGNVLVSLAMLQRCVVPVLALGDDPTGEKLVSEFSKAGAIIDHIHRRSDLQSPMLNQELDTMLGKHEFSFVCYETNLELPRYEAISAFELKSAVSVLMQCSIFYADRISESVLEAMAIAKRAGAVIFFEPSFIEENDLFECALEMTSILKYSIDRLGKRLSNATIDCIRIVTHGAEGLEVCDGQSSRWYTSIPASVVKDTCGSGDMVSVGLIDWLLTSELDDCDLCASDLLDGISAGQRLAAENCAYAGARGLFKKHGADYVRQILS